MKDLLKEDRVFWIGGLLVRMTLLLLVVCVSESLRNKTLKANMGQSKPEGKDFQREHGTV
jgi:hypothetical protein